MLDINKLKNQIRKDLRINNEEYDDEIKSLIQTSIEDLKTSSIASSYFDEEEELRPMLETAIKTYCKANFGYDNPDAERLQNSYELQKQKLAISHHDYRPLEERESGDDNGNV